MIDALLDGGLVEPWVAKTGDNVMIIGVFEPPSGRTMSTHERERLRDIEIKLEKIENTPFLYL